MSRSTVESLRPFFHPRSVAVVGASRDPAGVGHRVLEALQGSGFTGRIIPVNPYASEIAGLKAFPSVTAIPEPIDLAVIAVPADHVPTVIDDCAAAHVPAAIVITAGFAETGAAGRSLEEQLRDVVRRHEIRLLGPNCFGLMRLDSHVRLNATYTPIVPPAGRVALASESGGLGLAVVTAAPRIHLGLSSFVSVGNHADVTVEDLLEYWEQDETTDVILLYLETVADPTRFRAVAERTGKRKPIIVLKAGRTVAGQSAAGSHTAALATNDRAVDALFTQCGVLRAETLEEWLALATGFSSQPRPAGRRIGILTNSGGPGVLCADRCVAEGLVVPDISTDTQSQLALFLPKTAALKNPVDVIGFATEDQHARAVETLLTSDAIDALALVHVSVRPQDNPPVAAGILRGIRAARQAAGVKKPVYLCWMAEGDLDRIFRIDGEIIPSYRHPEMPPILVSRALTYDRWRTKPAATVRSFQANFAAAMAICAKGVSAHGTGWLGTEDSRALLAAVRLPVVRGQVVETEDDAVAVAREIGFPVAVKLASHRIVHKTEHGAVRLHLQHERDVREAYRAIRARLLQEHELEAMEGVLVQPMLSRGLEIAVGMSRDPIFGPLVAFGLGGVHIEILHDVQFRVAPITDQDAADMVRSIKAFPLLAGYRGQPAVDVKGIEEIVLRVASLAEAIPAIAEVDLNPIFALPDAEGCLIADARIRLEAP